VPVMIADTITEQTKVSHNRSVKKCQEKGNPTFFASY